MARLVGILRFLERSGAILLIMFAGLFLAFIINSTVALTVTAIILAMYLINEGLRKEHTSVIKILSIGLGAYLLAGVFTRTLTITLGVSSILPIAYSLYPYQLLGGTSAIMTFMTIYVFVFGASALAGLRLEEDQLWEAVAAIGSIGAVLIILIGLFTDPTTFITIGKSLPFLAGIISMFGFLGDVIALMLGEFISILVIFAIALVGGMIGEYVM